MTDDILSEEDIDMFIKESHSQDLEGVVVDMRRIVKEKKLI